MAERRGRRRVRAKAEEAVTQTPIERRNDFIFGSSFKKETVQEFADLMKRKYGKEMTEHEAGNALGNLVSYFKILHEWDIRSKKRAVSAPAIEKRDERS